MTAAARAGRGLPRRAPRRATPAPTGDWERFAAVLDDDFNTPAALAILHEWARERALVELRRGLGVFGLDVARRRGRAPGRRSSALAARARRGARLRGTSPRRTGCATRSRQPAGRFGTAPSGFVARAAARDARARLRPQRRARGAARPAGGARAAGSSERAAASLDWLGEGPRAAGRSRSAT